MEMDVILIAKIVILVLQAVILVDESGVFRR